VSSPSNLALFGLSAFVILLAIRGAGCFAQQSDPQRIITAENREISSRIADTPLALDRARTDLARLQKTKENLDAMAEALRAGGNSNATTMAFPSLNHLFQTCVTGSISEYVEIEETFSPKVLDMISTWILQRFPAATSARG
jgi:hypothetical protein